MCLLVRLKRYAKTIKCDLTETFFKWGFLALLTIIFFLNACHQHNLQVVCGWKFCLLFWRFFELLFCFAFNTATSPYRYRKFRFYFYLWEHSGGRIRNVTPWNGILLCNEKASNIIEMCGPGYVLSHFCDLCVAFGPSYKGSNGFK